MTKARTLNLLSIILCITGVATSRPLLAEKPPLPENLQKVTWQPVDAERARLIFQRIKDLGGGWTAASTKGWTGDYEVRVIARGSAVLSSSRFTDEPEEGMATVYHLDGDDLFLTHYCEAGNQPQLRLAEIDPSGDLLHWIFVGGGNLPTRNPGHMDELVMHLAEDVFTSRWSWHSNGVTRWMEDITYRRVQ